MTHTYYCEQCHHAIILENPKVVTYNGKVYFFHSVRSCFQDWQDEHGVDQDDLDRSFIRSTTD